MSQIVTQHYCLPLRNTFSY